MEDVPAQQQLTAHQDWVLLVPPRLTQVAFQLLVRHALVARSWHLEGRYGSRTHRDTSTQLMGLPVLPAIFPALRENAEWQAFFQSDDRIQVVVRPTVPSPRGKGLMTPVDARIHPERAPAHDGSASYASLETAVQAKKTLFTYAELFAGIGGFGVALQALGGQCVFCSELDEDCRALYTTNFPATAAANHLYGDIYQVTDHQLPAADACLDLLVGGFPCQPFSRLGDQPGLADPRGQLFGQIVRVLRISQPRAFLLENVPGLLAMPEAYQTIVTALEEVGYDVTTEVCNARGLTAASRKRLFFVGLRRRNDPTTTTTASTTPRLFEFPYVPDLALRASHVISYEDDDDTDDLLQISATQLDRLVHTNARWKPAHLAWPDRVCDTLDAHYGNSIGKAGSQLVPRAAPLRPRRFSPRECARLMGFPATAYQLPSLSERKAGQGEIAFCKQHYRMLGNAVCPPLVAALAGAVLGACLDDKEGWVAWGRATGVRLAWEATLQGKPPEKEEDDENHPSRKRGRSVEATS